MSGPPIPDIAERVRAAREAGRQVYPSYSNRASELGHPCERYLIFTRTRWEEKALLDPVISFIFRLGNKIEEAAKEELRETGFRVFEVPRGFRWEKFQISGHLDCMVAPPLSGWGESPDGGKSWPCEIKGLSPYEWERLPGKGFETTVLEGLDPFLKSKRPWMRKYPGQLLLYMLSENVEWGFFYIKNKLTGVPKALWLPLDFEYAEGLLQKAERVNAHIAAGTVPEPIEWEDAVCQGCAFLHICLPDRVMGISPEILEDKLLEGKLARREILATAARDYEALDKEIKARFKGVPSALVGAWQIFGKEIARKGYTVADVTYWQTKIARISQEPLRAEDFSAADAAFLRFAALEIEE